jgi:hypothetical protein
MERQLLENTLANFSSELVPSDDFLTTEKKTVDRIFTLLQKSKFFKVDRVKIAGSIGKKTAVCVDPDFDLVAFINDQHPPFTKVLDNFEDILKTSDMDIKHVKVTQYSIQFEVDHIGFDLLPATNFVNLSPQPGGEVLARIQAEKALECITKNPGRDGYKYGSACAEQQVEFLKNQSPFVHSVVRLAKFWNKTLHQFPYISGRSTMIELIAIHAATIQEQGQRSCLEGFKIFLTLMKEFDKLSIIFFEGSQVPAFVRDQRPLVLDPVNPYNNFADFRDDNKANVISKFKEYSSTTLARLNGFTGLPHLFEVQPKIFIPAILQPPNWVVSPKTMKLVNPKMNVRMSDKDFKPKDLAVKAMQTCFMTSMAALTLGGKKVDMTDVDEAMKNCVDLNILGNPSPRHWGGSGGKHEDFNVTFMIPVPGIPDQCMELSASWK